MAVLDLIWMVTSYAALLAFIAIMGVIIFKVGIISFKLSINAVGATRGIENIRGVVNQPDRKIASETDEIEIIVSQVNSFIQTSIERNYYAKYAYNLFRVELIISYIKPLKNFVESKLEKIDDTEYMYELFKIEKVISCVYSLKSFIEPKLEKIDAEYIYELFKIEKVISRINSLKSFVESKREKNFAKYAYIQLFKK